jgi:hypothetical protein
MSWRRLGVWCLTLLVCVALIGCRCSREATVARLIEARGTIDRDYADHLNDWVSAPRGAEFSMGDGVRSQKESDAVLELTGGAKLTLHPASLIRFLATATPGALALDVEVGDAVLETREHALRISSRFGAVVVDPMTRVVLEKADSGLRFKVALGRIAVETEPGESVPVNAGHAIRIGVGGVVLDDAGGAAPSAASAQPSAAAPNAQPILAVPRGAVAQRLPGATASSPLGGETTLTPGTTLDVGRGGAVDVRRGSESATLGEGQFVVGLPGGVLVQAIRGAVQLTAPGASIQVPGGVIIAKDELASAEVLPAAPGAEAGTQITVRRGRVEVRARETNELVGGEAGTLAADGQLQISGRGPEHIDLVVDAGDTFTVHDPRPPTAVGFRVGARCPNGAAIALGKQLWSVRGDRASVPLRTGRHAYELRCLERDAVGPSVASGVVTIVDDAGTRTLPKSAATTHVNTDGRRYTVLYQNLVPALSIGWATAPPAPGYTLVVQGAAARTVQLTTANHAFAAGALPEGTHTVYFEAKTTPARRSRTTTIVIAFDNATPTASIEGPIELERGADVTLAGTAMPGWSVSVNGESIPVDGQQRFRAKVAVGADGVAVPIAFRHPSRGVHYYLRKVK